MKNKYARVIAAIIVFLFSSFSSALAQEELDLKKIVVTPGRIEQSEGATARTVDVVTAKELAYSGARTAAEALSAISSLSVMDYGGLGGLKTVQMRGSTASQMLLMVDGRPVNSAHSGDFDLNTLSVASIERIEVLRGGASSLYGSSAMGGVVNVITKNPPKEKQKTAFTTAFGSFRTYLEQITHGARLGKFGYLATGEYKSSQGHRDHSEYSAKNAGLKLEYEFDEGNTLRLGSGFHRSDYETPGPLTWLDYSDYQRTYKRFYDLQWDWQAGEGTLIKSKIYGNYDRFEYTEVPVPLDRSVHNTITRGYEMQVSHAFSEIYSVLAGGSLVGNYDDSNKSGKHRYFQRSGFMQHTLQPWEFLAVEFGGRADDYSNFGTQLTPNIGVRSDIGENTTLRATHTRSYRVPTFSDLYWPNTGWEAGNPNLRPEKGRGYEFSVEQRIRERAVVSLGYFRNDYSQLIKWEETSPWFWTPRNISKACIQGVEFGATMPLGELFEVRAGYTWQRPMNKMLHKYLTYQPWHKATGALVFHDTEGLRLALKGQFVGRVYTNEANTQYLKQYFLLGVEASKKLTRQFTVFLNLDNVTDRVYQVQRDYPVPGFAMQAGCTLEF